MGHLESLIEAVAARIQHDEMVRRIGRPLRIAIPDVAPPITVLAARSFPPEVRARRTRLHETLGWAGGELPAIATLEDRVAVEPGLASSDPDAEAWWDALFDAAADEADPGWRWAARRADADFARFEGVTVLSDARFGRRRRAGTWEALRELVRWAGITKRRLVG